MRKGLVLLLFGVVLLAGCSGNAAAPPMKQPYHVNLTKQGVLVLDTNYVGTLTESDGTKLGMRLEHVYENMTTGGFNALLTIDTQFSKLPVKGIIDPYVNGKPPVQDGSAPLLITFTYLDTLSLFGGQPNMQTGVISGDATTSLIGTDDPWSLRPL